jgi:hypothetical protein
LLIPIYHGSYGVGVPSAGEMMIMNAYFPWQEIVVGKGDWFLMVVEVWF